MLTAQETHTHPTVSFIRNLLPVTALYLTILSLFYPLDPPPPPLGQLKLLFMYHGKTISKKSTNRSRFLLVYIRVVIFSIVLLLLYHIHNFLINTDILVSHYAGMQNGPAVVIYMHE